jgi:hypothetical protein
MLIRGTQIHIVTFSFILLEFCMFIWQMARYFYRLRDRHRGWYIMLLLLLLLYNVTNGLFPDPNIALPVKTQNMIAYGTTFIIISYFPFYFYKEFDLTVLRKHVLYGVPLFLILPYMLFFVIMYTINGELKKDVSYGVILPFAYSLVLLWVIFRAIRIRYRQNRNDHFYLEEISVYCAILPWVPMTVFAWLEVGQVVQSLCANLGFFVITIIFFYQSAKRAMLEYLEENAITIGETNPYLFQANCLHFDLTKMEILIIQHLYKGRSNKEIADLMSISENTVKKHIQNAYRKTLL